MPGQILFLKTGIFISHLYIKNYIHNCQLIQNVVSLTGGIMKFIVTLLLVILTINQPSDLLLYQTSIRRTHYILVPLKVETWYKEITDTLGISPLIYQKGEKAILDFFRKIYTTLLESGKSETEIEYFLKRGMEVLLETAAIDRENIAASEPFSRTIKSQLEPVIYSAYTKLYEILPSQYIPDYEQISRRIIFSPLPSTPSIGYTNTVLGIIVIDIGKALHTPLIPNEGIGKSLEYEFIHEILHLISPVSFNFLWDEGVAVYISRKLTGYQGNESMEYKTVKEMVETIGEETVLKCYLTGDLRPIAEKLGAKFVTLLNLSAIVRTYIMVADKYKYYKYANELVQSCSQFLSPDVVENLKEARDPVSILIWKLHDNPEALNLLENEMRNIISEIELHP